MAKEQRKHGLTLAEFYNKLFKLTNNIERDKDIPVTVSRSGYNDYIVTGVAVFGNKVRITTEIAPLPQSQVKNEVTDTAKETIG